MERILFIQLRQLGDTLISTPAIRQLARLHPGAEIDVLCQNANACILENNPHVAGIEILPRGASAGYFVRLAARLRRRRYDMVIDAQALSKTAVLSWLTGAPRRLGFHRRWRHHLYTDSYRTVDVEYSVINKLRLLQDDRVDLEDLTMDFPVDEEVRREATAFCERFFRTPVAAIYGVGQLSYRIWPAAKFAEIGDRLAQYGYQPFLIYGPGQKQAAQEICDLLHYPALIDYPMPSFPVLKEVIASCELMVANDGGPKHLATVAGTPCVTLFDREDSATNWNAPGRADLRVVSTCSKSTSQVVEGSFTDAATLADIEVESVWAEVEQLFERGFVTRPNCAA